MLCRSWGPLSSLEFTNDCGAKMIIHAGNGVRKLV